METARRWFRRNRNYVFVGAGVIGAGYLVGQYVLSKLQEARQRMTEDRVAKENLQRRFRQNQEDCTYTVLALLPTVREEVFSALPVEQISEQLQQERQERLQRGGVRSDASSVPDEDKSVTSSGYVDAAAEHSPPRRKRAELWEEMKINSIVRALTLLYTLSLLTLLTRIQLNLLGRRTYLSSVVALAAPPDIQGSTKISLENRDDDGYEVYGNDFETNRKYLTFSWWLLHRGSLQIMNRVREAVEEVFGWVNIREEVTMERLSELIMDVRRKVEGATEDERLETQWLPYLLPSKSEEADVIRQAGSTDDSTDINPSLRRLLEETSDLIESPPFTQVLTHTLDFTYSHLVDHYVAIEAFKQVKIKKLAHILPVFCRQAHFISTGSGDVANEENEYLCAIDKTRELEAFAAIIYSSNFEYEIETKADVGNGVALEHAWKRALAEEDGTLVDSGQ
ncbi:Peroxin-3 [Piedraia hortae CBS 480.64]|uniref:Peroxin-3 n=1 Tax=Piedraia hortae CBS 480.64 TaxID=1314780 RepID=A0A6A7C3Z7_9PEZI|nr:Peroxin-3 [Piedraia hortae CBS 480.64]